LEGQLCRYSPATFAQLTSGGKWRAARHLNYLDQALVDALAEAEAGRLDGLVVSMPPQHGKSELCSKYLPAWFLGTHPDKRVILTAYEADFAAGWGRKARDLLEAHGRRFGVRVSAKSSAAQRWDLERFDGGMMTAGVGGPITGKGAHLLIVDDPIKNDEQARSATQRQKQWEWWQSVAGTRLRPGALTVVIQTRWHRDDLSGRILEQAERTGRWRQIVFPALAESMDVLGRSPGEALWPEVYTRERLEQVKASRTPYYWQSLYQQNPIAEGSAEWPESYFSPSIWFDEWPTAWQCKAVALDPSKGTDAKFGDYSAFVLLLVDVDGVLYVDADLARRNIQVMIDTAVELQHVFRPDWFGVEVNQFQQLLGGELLARARQRGVLLPVYEINNQVNKQVRIRRLTPYLAQGRIRFKARSPGARLLVEQLRDFPHGDHDDGPDALEMALRLAAELLNQPAHDENPITRILLERGFV
jgi:predicted phage terminase large subunit-like protein